VLGLRRSQSHPVADKRIEHSAQKREHGCEPFPDLLCPMRSVEYAAIATSLRIQCTSYVGDAIGMRDGLALYLTRERYRKAGNITPL
jgi:hypothetical protein